MTTQTPMQAMQEKLKAQREAAEALKALSPEDKAKLDIEANQLKSASANEEMFQQYRSAQASTRMITDKGIRFNFVNHELLTKDPHIIEYLDSQISLPGYFGITKGEALSSSDRDPMKALERALRIKIKKEIEEEAIAKALGESRDMGNYAAPAISPLNSKQTAS